MKRELTCLLGSIISCTCVLYLFLFIGVPNLQGVVFEQEPEVENRYEVNSETELVSALRTSLSQVELLYYLLHENSYEKPTVSTLENGDELYEFPRLGWKVTKFQDKKILPRAERMG